MNATPGTGSLLGIGAAAARAGVQDLRATVEAKRLAIDGFLADLDARIGPSEDWLASMTPDLRATVTVSELPPSVRHHGF
jgi:hypothetical protein